MHLVAALVGVALLLVVHHVMHYVMHYVMYM